MKIIGHGMIARSFMPYQTKLPHVTIFASGVADSTTTEPAAYRREINLLQSILSTIRSEQGSGQLVYFSSGGAIYGPTGQLRDENTATQPNTVYGHHQIDCEQIIHNSGVNYLIIRLPNVVGANQNSSQLIPALIQQAYAGSVTLFRYATRDLLDVTDVASLTMKLLQKSVTNEMVVVASGISYPIHTIFNHIQSLMNTSAEITIVEQGSPQRFDISKLKSLLDAPLVFNDDYLHQILQQYIAGYVNDPKPF